MQRTTFLASFRKHLTILIALAIVLSASYINVSFADEGSFKIGYVTTNLRIREQPTTESAQIGLYHKDDRIKVYGMVDDWYIVENGYVFSQYVILIENTSFEESNEEFYTTKDMTTSNMEFMKTHYYGYLPTKTKGTGVTNSKTLNFVGWIPIYDIINGYAYLPSNRDIYKISISSFIDIQSVGESSEILDAYRTIYFSSNSNRKYNIWLVSTKIDGTIVKSGSTFSYNSTTGPRGEKQGYKIATVIKNGEYVEDYGGGVCQVSSTIYAAIMHDPNLKIVNRKAHALEVSYLPLNMDATVSYDGTDFKFKNNYPFDIRINIYAEDSVCIVTITKAE